MDEWEKAQSAEADFWGTCADTSDEEYKQRQYATLMGIDGYKESQGLRAERYNLRGRSVLDLGGGPVSMLLKCENRGRSVVVDPTSFPEWVLGRYEAAGIEFICKPAEGLALDGTFDEVWIYNVLQHVQDPEAVIATAKRYGGVVRIFEWVDIPADEKHPHTLTRAGLDKWLECKGRVDDVSWHPYKNAYTAVIQGAHANPLRFHLLGLPHIPTTTEFQNCAYTQKIVKLGRMLAGLGHDVTFYGGEGSDVMCKEFVPILSNAERVACYGEYNWRKGFFREGDGEDAAHQAFNANAIREIGARKQSGDFLLCPMGLHDKPIADAVGGDMHVVESGIGYSGIFSDKRVFESYAWMHHLYGRYGQDDGGWYDAVIPNYFDPADFPYQAAKGDYVLFIGRLIRRKGLDVAVQVTKALGLPLIVAGQGELVNPNEGLAITDAHVTHVGSVGAEERGRLMGGARCIMAPTYYLEPFGGVAVEAQLCGTPVITSDWGAFPETIQHGKTGYRCRTFEQFCWSVSNADKLSPADCHNWAVANYSMGRVAQMYNEYFHMLADVSSGGGWYERHDDRTSMDWLCKK